MYRITDMSATHYEVTDGYVSTYFAACTLRHDPAPDEEPLPEEEISAMREWLHSKEAYEDVCKFAKAQTDAENAEFAALLD